MAHGASSPFAIRSGRRTPVSLSLTATHAPTLDASQIPDGAARNAELTLVGTNFGTEAAAIRATLKQGTQAPKPVEIVELLSPTRMRACSHPASSSRPQACRARRCAWRCAIRAEPAAPRPRRWAKSTACSMSSCRRCRASMITWTCWPPSKPRPKSWV
ncbi:hypothetical protein D3C72_1987260 [compost metagenome]